MAKRRPHAGQPPETYDLIKTASKKRSLAIRGFDLYKEHMPIPPDAVRAYLDDLPEDRREAIEAVRETITRNLPVGYEEGIQYGMPAWFVPHSVFPDGYHCDPTQPVPFVSVASQKKHIGLYFFCIYLDEDLRGWFESEWRKTGKRWDAGKSCVRVKTLEDIPLPLVGKLIKKVPVKKFLASYLPIRPTPKKKTVTKAATKKAATKTAATKKAVP